MKGAKVHFLKANESLMAFLKVFTQVMLRIEVAHLIFRSIRAAK